MQNHWNPNDLYNRRNNHIYLFDLSFQEVRLDAELYFPINFWKKMVKPRVNNNRAMCSNQCMLINRCHITNRKKNGCIVIMENMQLFIFLSYVIIQRDRYYRDFFTHIPRVILWRYNIKLLHIFSISLNIISLLLCVHLVTKRHNISS
jgi:hypothetical protein